MVQDNSFKLIAAKWQKKWEESKIYKAVEDPKKKKFYCLEMFPYPSAAGLHMGHALNYTIGDIYARFKRMQGYTVLYPMGYDAFGLPAENAAIKAKEHPASYTEMSMKNFVMQQKALGLSYDWERKVVTCKPDYYRWNQYFFIKLFEKGLVYRKKSAVNWCPKCNTVLANEQVHQGKCWRHEDTDVELKQLEQWFIRTTAYTEELLRDIEKLNWPDRIKIMQENWIGKSFGSEVDFSIERDAKKTNCIIIHGCASIPERLIDITKPDAKYWIVWLKASLERLGIQTHAPMMPLSWKPDYHEWKKMMDDLPIHEDSVLIGHSCGASFLVRWLGETKKKISKLILVAPAKIPKQEASDELKAMYSFEIDPSIKNNIGESTIFISDNEDPRHKEAVKIFNSVLNGKVIELKNKGHFIFEHTGTIEFPELLAEIKIKRWPIFTTRADTLFGVTFMVVSAQHPRLAELVTKEQKPKVDAFLKKLKSVSEKELEEMEKEGVFTGSYAINPITKEKVPVWAGNFVIADYGAGMVMAVPAHDQRDFEFAEKYKIPIKTVVEPLFVSTEGVDKVEESKPFVERRSIAAIVKHWSEDKFAVLKWKKVAWHTIITGGIEKGQTPLEAAVAEIQQETGYLHPTLIKEMGVFHSKFYHAPKGENRFGHFQAFLFRLADSERVQVSKEELDKHELSWVTLDEVKKLLTAKSHQWLLSQIEDKAFTDYGILVSSGKFSGLNSEDARDVITAELEKSSLGKKTFNYKFRDWLVSRQRYWGTPIPMVYCNECGVQPVKEKDLPILLPKDVKFGEGNPLLTNMEFVNTACPKCGKPARRETDTMDTFFDSSWYYLRYCDNTNSEKPFDKKKAEHWMPVDIYIGGAEHACMHLIYARFFTKALRDMGLVDIDEPFPKLFNQGMLHGSDGNKMSKSLGNVVNPIDTIERFSADALRFNLMSLASPDSDSVWSDKGMESTHKYVTRIFENLSSSQITSSTPRVKSKIHRCIKEATELIETFRYNIAIIKIREAFDFMEKEEIGREEFEMFVKLLHPFCPHLTEEIWERTGHIEMLCNTSWPKPDESLIDDKFDAMDQLVANTISDINAVKKLINAEKIERITIIVSPEWKYDLFSKVKTELDKTRNAGDILKSIMATDLKKYGQDITRIVPALVKDPAKIPSIILTQEQEIAALLDAGEKIEEMFDADLKIIKAEESNDAKARNASPAKPAIVLSCN